MLYMVLIYSGTLDLLPLGELLQGQDLDPGPDLGPGPDPDHGQGQGPEVVEGWFSLFVISFFFYNFNIDKCKVKATYMFVNFGSVSPILMVTHVFDSDQGPEVVGGEFSQL